MDPKEIRSLVFIIEPINPSKQYLTKYKEYTLGQMELKWNNSFGDPGFMQVGPFKFSKENSDLKIDLKLIEDDGI